MAITAKGTDGSGLMEGRLASSEADAKQEFDHYKNIQREVVNRMASSFRMYTSRDAREHMEGLESESGWRARGKTAFSDRVDDARKNLTTYLPKLQSRLATLETDFVSKMEKAKKWIGQESYNDWMKRLADNSSSHWEKEAFLTQKFPEYYKNWEKYGKAADEIKAMKEKYKLTGEDLSVIQEEKNLKSLKFPAKLTLALHIKEHMEAYVAERERAMSKARSLLNGESGKTIAPENVEKWMKHIFQRYSGWKAIAFVQNQLPQYITNWRNVSASYTDLRNQCEQKGLKGSKLYTDAEFVKLDWTSRQAKVVELKSLLGKPLSEGDQNVSEQQKKSVDYLKMRIRFNLGTQDWETAGELLDQAKRIDDHDFDIMRLDEYYCKYGKNVFEAAKEKTGKSKEKFPSDYLREIWEFLDVVPEFKPILERALREHDVDVFERVLQTIYNRVWCWEHRYLNEEREQEGVKDDGNVEQTKEYMQDGHSRALERNIIAGETAHKSAIRGDDCNRPQLAFMSNETESVNSFVERAREHKREKHSKWGYWTTYIAMDKNRNLVKYDKQKYFVKNVYYHLRSSVKKYFESGERYVSRGWADPQSVKPTSTTMPKKAAPPPPSISNSAPASQAA